MLISLLPGRHKCCDDVLPLFFSCGSSRADTIARLLSVWLLRQPKKQSSTHAMGRADDGENGRRDDRPSLLDDGNGRRNPFLMATFFPDKGDKGANNNRPHRACLACSLSSRRRCVLEMRQTVRYETSALGVLLKANGQLSI